MPTAIIYARVSDPKQAAEGLPVESQILECQKKAAEMDARVLKVFKDEGISGTGTAARKAWQAAMLFCETHDVDYFICWDTKRFARNHEDAVIHKVILRAAGTQMIYASQSFEGEDGWLMEGMFQLFDEHQSRRVGRDTMRSMAKNARDGFWNGGHIPFGFAPVAIGKRKRLEPQAEEAAVVRTIYRWCLQGSGTKDIAQRLNKTGTTHRGRPWDKAKVATILGNRAVIGQLVFTVGEEEIITPAHAPIISEEEFMSAQEAIRSRTPQNVGGRPRSIAAFSGLLRCGTCGEAMITETATGRTARYHYYNCRSFLKGKGCTSRRIPVEGLDKYLLDNILDKVFTHENIASMVTDIKTVSHTWIQDHEARLLVAHRELKDVSAKLTRLYESIEAGAGLQLGDVAPRIRMHKSNKEALERQIAELEQQEGPQILVTEADLDQAAKLFREMVSACEDPRRLRGFLGTFVRRVVILGEEASIEYWPERIVNAPKGGSHCDVSWLPDLSSLRTIRVVLMGRMAA